METIAIIPARSGSKRIPGKNIKIFHGKPVIAYSIEAAISSNLFDIVMVSTDDEKIALISKEYGAEVPFLRSDKNSDDHAPTFDVLEEVLNTYREIFNLNFRYGCCIYPAAPLINIQYLQEGYNLLKEKDSDTVFPVVPFSYPVWRGLELSPDKKATMIWPEFLKSRSQDMQTVYHDAGQWYWFNVEKLLNGKKMFAKGSNVIIMGKNEVQDIDTLEDWKLAEMKYTLLNKRF